MILQLFCMIDGIDSPFDGKYLLSYDPEHHQPDGSYDGGLLEVTDDPTKAQRFADVIEALEAWRQGPTCPCHSLRSDGKPNRPLTAFTVTTLSEVTNEQN